MGRRGCALALGNLAQSRPHTLDELLINRRTIELFLPKIGRGGPVALGYGCMHFAGQGR